MDYQWEEYIKKLAYYKWEAAGRPDGQADRFWLDAEKEFFDNLDSNPWMRHPVPFDE